jgi:hypothetical protein
MDGMPYRVEERLPKLFQSGEVLKNQPRHIERRSREAA